MLSPIDISRKAAALAALCLAVLLAACGGDDAGNPVKPGKTWALTVVVTSEQGAPIRNATVRVLSGPDATKTATTDQSGSAVFSALQEGSFTIEVTASEFYSTTTPVTLTTSRTVAVSLKERNRAPVISALVSRGSHLNQPSGLADVGQSLEIVATITDKETPVANLALEWAADAGAITGDGTTVHWTPPASVIPPAVATIALTITERFTEPGSSVPLENKTTGELKIRIHDFEAESAAVSLQFLRDFSDSTIPADPVIARSFATSARCADGRAAELRDVSENREGYVINASRLGTATVAVHFQSISPYRERPGDAWVDIPCGWTSTKKAGGVESVDGMCRMVTVFDVDRWALCWSDFEGHLSPAAAGFIR